MKHYQMRINEENMINLAVTEDKEVMEAHFISHHLTSTLMICSKTMTCSVNTHGRKSTLKITSEVIGKLTIGRDVLSRSSPLEVDCLMMCLKIWKRCFLLVTLKMHTDMQCELTTGSMDPASTAGLSLRDEETWLLHTQTVLDNNVSFLFISSSFDASIILLGYVLIWKEIFELCILKNT